MMLMRMYNDTVVEPRNQPADPTSNPKHWNYNWINWLDYPMPPTVREIDTD
jgi:hypothetical protein